MRTNEIVARGEWLAARKALLAKEKEMTRALDRLRAERRALPWVKVEKPYLFDTPAGKATLADLFDGRSQLAVYHFMLAPGSDRICDGCAFLADHVDAARMHFEHADLSFAAVSRAPLERIERVRERMGWRFRWVSSGGGDFNHDFGVSFTPEQVAAGGVGYNYGTSSYAAEDLHGASVFAKAGNGDVFHTYSTYARGAELLSGAFNWLDLAPKGRNEARIMDWVRLRADEPGRRVGSIEKEQRMRGEPQKEHRWLEQFLGEWTYEAEAVMAPGRPPVTSRGTESVRSLGGLWVVGEGEGECPGGGPANTLLTVGFDPRTGRFTGTWIGSMMTHLWVYDGWLDADGKVLTLEAEGPAFTGEGKMATYRDVTEFKSADHRVLTSQVRGDDGAWNRFMTAHYRRRA